MSNLEEMRAVAQECPKYVYIGDSRAELLSATVPGEHDVRCDTCVHWENGRCVVDMYDQVLTGLDQT